MAGTVNTSAVLTALPTAPPNPLFYTWEARCDERNVSSILGQLQRDISVEKLCPIWQFQRLSHCSQVLACVKGPLRFAFGHP
jgi:hypothetical protein